MIFGLAGVGQPVSKKLIDVVIACTLGHLRILDVVDAVDKAEFRCLLCGEPVVLPVKILLTHRFRSALAAVSYHLRQADLQVLDHLGCIPQLLCRTILPALNAVQHQPRVAGHIERLAAQGYDGRDGCGHTVNVDINVRL